MRILPVAVIGLAMFTAGCGGGTQRSAAPQPTAPSGAASTTMGTAAQPDSIDRFAAVYEQRGRRY